MQEYSSSHVRIEQLPFRTTFMLNAMPHPPEMAYLGDKTEAIRQANMDAAKVSARDWFRGFYF